MPSEEQEQRIQQGLEELRQAAEYLTANPPQWPPLTLTKTSSGYIVQGQSTYTLPLPEQLQTDILHALLHELTKPATEEAYLLGQCGLRYRAIDDWDGPGQLVGVVLSAPSPIYDRLKGNKI